MEIKTLENNIDSNFKICFVSCAITENTLNSLNKYCKDFKTTKSKLIRELITQHLKDELYL